MSAHSRKVVLGLGTNCGDRLGSLRRAIGRLREIPDLHVVAVSPIYESDALLPENAPSDWAMQFLNLAVLCESALEPLHLLAAVKAIEEDLGRVPRGRWAPRELDIDILTMEGIQLQSFELNLPHPELLNRPFALLPLVDVAPELDGYREKAAKWLACSPEQVPFRARRALSPLCEVVGIVNVTPDSFSDAFPTESHFAAAQHAIEQGVQLIQDGATVLDIGGESTRPGAKPVTASEEWRRIEPVIRGLAERGALLSIDTRHPEVARLALDHGADWINDVSGFSNPEMIDAVLEWECDLVAMHSLSVPADSKITLPLDQDPVRLIVQWCEHRLRLLEESGISRSRVILDPGVGFGKTVQQSLRILEGIGEIRAKSPRLLVGHSRKSFIGGATGDRDFETALISVELARAGVDYLRVHDVKSTMRALRTWIQIDGVAKRCPATFGGPPAS